MLSRIIRFSFYLLFFLTPLIMTPYNHELFEFNKMILVYLLTIIITASWLIKMILAKKIIFQRTFWDIPLIIFFGSQLISFFFSIDQHTSFWGYYSRFNGGLLSLIAYLLLYWAYVSNLAQKQTKIILRLLLISTALVAAYGIAERFGIDAQYWVQDVQNRVFSTLGQPNWLAAFLAATIPLSWYFIIQKPKIILYSQFCLLYSCLLFTKSRSGLIGFGLAFVIFWGLQRHKNALKPFLLITFLLLLITFIIGTPWGPKGILKDAPKPAESETAASIPLISDSGDIRKVVWQGAISIWRHHPLFGTGPETFAYSYYWFRPREHNELSEWNFLYNKAHNEYLNYAATTGTVGLLAYLGIIGAFIFWSLIKITNLQFSNFQSITNFLIFKPKNIENLDIKNSLKIRKLKIENYTNTALLGGFVSILVTNFFGFSVVMVNLLFFLLPAMATTRNEKLKVKNEKQKFSLNQYLTIVLVLAFTFYFLLFTFQYWYADTRLAAGEKFIQANQPELASNQLTKTIKLRPQEPLYHDTLAGIKADLSLVAFEQNDTGLSAKLAQEAIAASDAALTISPFHLSFWKNRTRIFYQLAKTDPQYYQSALESLSKTSLLAPTDAKIKYNLALIYAQFDQINLTIELLQETVQLKPNYEDARFALAIFYQQVGENQKAQEELKYILQNINPLSQKAQEALAN